MNNQNEPFSVPDGGDKRDRTADLLNAIQALSQFNHALPQIQDVAEPSVSHEEKAETQWVRGFKSCLFGEMASK